MKDLRKTITYGDHREGNGSRSINDWVYQQPPSRRKTEGNQDWTHPIAYDSGRASNGDDNMYHESSWQRQSWDARHDNPGRVEDAFRRVAC